MCLVIDTCCFANVFDSKSKNHTEYAPILKWITVGKGSVVFGGTKYRRELEGAVKYLRLLSELEKQRRVIRLPEQRVDEIATAIKEKYPDPEFNDEHLVAIVIVSRCCVVCTNDDEAINYLRDAEVFRPYKVKRPKIYRHKKHVSLCCDDNLVRVCLRNKILAR